MVILIILLVGILIGICLAAKGQQNAINSENIRIRKKSEKEHEELIRIKYPNAYRLFWDKPNRILTNQAGVSIRTEDCKNWDDFTWNYFEISITSKKAAQKIIDSNKRWEAEQKEYSSFSCEIAKSIIPNFGRYVYDIVLEPIPYQYLHMSVWQFFAFDVCHEVDLDYEYVPTVKNNNCIFRDKGVRSFFLKYSEYAEPIKSIIVELSKKNNTILFYNDVIEGLSYEEISLPYTKINLRGFDTINLAPKKAIGIEDSLKTGWEVLQQKSPDYVVLIDAYTDNESLEKNCKRIFEIFQDKHPKITYISIVKCYDRDEMTELIEETINKE